MSLTTLATAELKRDRRDVEGLESGATAPEPDSSAYLRRPAASLCSASSGLPLMSGNPRLVDRDQSGAVSASSGHTKARWSLLCSLTMAMYSRREALGT